MRRDRSWIKLYLSDVLENGISIHLTLAQQGLWFRLYCLSARCELPGTVNILPGKPYPTEQLARRLRVKPTVLTDTLHTLELIGLITRDGEGIHIAHFVEDQPEWQPRLPGIEDPPQPPPDRHGWKPKGRKRAEIEPLQHGQLTFKQAAAGYHLGPDGWPVEKPENSPP